MVILLGASGYIGQSFVEALRARQWPFTPLARKDVDYTDSDTLWRFLRDTRPEFVINAAGFTGKPNVDACETAPADTLLGNTLLPQTLAEICAATSTPWGHVSSGCIYSGAKICRGSAIRVEKDLTTPELRRLVDESPDTIRGFTEEDTPNFSFRDPPCSFYSGTKALAEEAVNGIGQCYLWRLRIPFDRVDNSRNYLSKIQRYSKVYNNVNSISHRDDFVGACLALWERRAPFGIYNVTNPGFVTTRHVVDLIERTLHLRRRFEFWESDEEFYRVAARTPRSNCVLDSSKLLATGVALRPVEEALEDSLRQWQPENSRNS